MKTISAIEIMNRHFGNDTETQERLADERIKSLAAMVIYNARTAAGLTQQQLAELVGTKQPVIARLEDADYEGHTTAMLNRIAKALNQRLELRFVPLQTTETVAPAVPEQNETNALLITLLDEVRSLKSNGAVQKRDRSKKRVAVEA